MAAEDIFDLKGKVALITGGYRGIGEIFTKTLAKAGVNVAIAARNKDRCAQLADELEAAYGIKAIGVAVDVVKKESVRELVSRVSDEFKHIDILINSAGVSGVQKPTVELEEEELDYVFNVDFKGTLFCSQEVAGLMMKQNGGKIINVASIAGKLAIPYMAGYCISKASVIQLTRVMALELARYNIQVNALCPGYFLSDMNKEFFESKRGRQYINERIPLKRLGDLRELESSVIYLASAPAYLTGTEIVIDGAQSII